MPDLTPTQKAAAFHGLATNPAIPPQERMALALQALDLYEAEVERLRGQLDKARAIADRLGDTTTEEPA